MRFLAVLGLTAGSFLAACKKEEPPPVYQAIPIARRDIVVRPQKKLVPG